MSEQTLLTPGEIKGYRSIVWRKMEYEPLVNIEGLLKAQMPNFALFLLLPFYLICRTLTEQRPSNDFWDDLK